MLAVKRKGIEAVMVIVLFLLETTVFHYFEIASVKPNLLLILTASFGFMEGKREGMYVGVLSGFLLDICLDSISGSIFYSTHWLVMPMDFFRSCTMMRILSSLCC